MVRLWSGPNPQRRTTDTTYTDSIATDKGSRLSSSFAPSSLQSSTDLLLKWKASHFLFQVMLDPCPDVSAVTLEKPNLGEEHAAHRRQSNNTTVTHVLTETETRTRVELANLKVNLRKQYSAISQSACLRKYGRKANMIIHLSKVCHFYIFINYVCFKPNLHKVSLGRIWRLQENTFALCFRNSIHPEK